MNQIDWVISISIFMLYLSWFFLLIRPYYFPIEDIPLTRELESALLSDLMWEVEKTPLIINSEISGSLELVMVNYTLGLDENHFAFSDNRYFTLYKDTMYFLADLVKGQNLFWLVSSDEIYNKSKIQTDLTATEYSSSVSNMGVNFYDGKPRRIYYNNELAIDDFEIMRHGIEIEVNSSSFFSSKIMSVHEVDSDFGFNHSSYVFSHNTRLYNNIVLDRYIDIRTIMLSMKINGYPNYYSNNEFFGTVQYPEQCFEYDNDKLFLYNDNNVISFIIDAMEDETEFALCYYDEDKIELNITMKVQKEAKYRIYFEPFAIIPNGDFNEGFKYWNFVNNTNPYRTCTSKEGTQILLTEENTEQPTDSYYDYIRTGDWSNNSISGLPIMGFGTNKSKLNGTGGNYDGELLSDSFVIPDYAQYLHVWRNFILNSFDNHYNATMDMNLPDALYFELRDADTGALLYTIDKYEAQVDSEYYNITGSKIVNISALHGRKATLSLNVIGNINADPYLCSDGGGDDALVQIDDLYFSDEYGTKIKPRFNAEQIMSRIQSGDYKANFGLPEKLTGLSEEKIEMLLDLSYNDIKLLWGIPFSRDFVTTITNQT